MHVQVYVTCFILGRTAVTSVIKFGLKCMFWFKKKTYCIQNSKHRSAKLGNKQVACEGTSNHTQRSVTINVTKQIPVCPV